MHLIRSLVVAWLGVAAVTPAAAQSADVVGSARDAAKAGRRPDALSALAAHLVESPRDVDARVLYGIVLSWDGQYDEARRQLRQVLDQSPGYTDARVALMHLEWWSGRREAAGDAANEILSRDPGNQAAQRMREQLAADARPWSAEVRYAHDSFSDQRPGWQEYSLAATRQTSRGSFIVRASEARRFGLDDRMIEVEAYPRIRPGTYAFVSVGIAPASALYPSYRVAFDVYHGLGSGFEVSGGFRRLGFDSKTHIFVGTVSKYLGRWLITGRAFHVPGDGSPDSTSYHAGFRRYVRGDGTSYFGATYSRGFSREEIRDLADLATLDSDGIRVETTQQLTDRLRLFAIGGTSRQERQDRAPLWQTSLSSGLTVLF